VLADRVYELIKAMVMDYEIEPGASVGIEQLARDPCSFLAPVPAAGYTSSLVRSGTPCSPTTSRSASVTSAATATCIAGCPSNSTRTHEIFTNCLS
jgi:hypothetical protein